MKTERDHYLDRWMDGWTTKSGKKFGVKFVVEPWGHAFVGPKKNGSQIEAEVEAEQLSC